MTELHTVERWRKLQRQVRLHEPAYKRVKGLYNDPERMAELYGYWQTDPYVCKLTEDGKIPTVRLLESHHNLELIREYRGVQWPSPREYGLRRFAQSCADLPKT